jgi:hypothetical protein
MSDELLREIRGILARQELARKRWMRAGSFVMAVLLCLVAYMSVRLVRLADEVEQAPPPVVAPK